MKKLLALLLVSLMATAAFAQIDPDPDSFGVYLDVAGTNANLGTMSPLTKTVYLILMNPSTQIKGFELAYEIVPNPAMAATFGDDLLRTSQVISGGSYVDLGTSTDPTIGDFRCGYALARAAVPAMVMVTWKFRYYGDEDLGMDFFIRGVATNASGPSGGWPVVDGGSGIGLRRAGTHSGSLTAPVASTVYGPVATEQSSFGSVKSLFR